MVQYNTTQYNAIQCITIQWIQYKKNTLTKLNIRASPVLATRRLVLFANCFSHVSCSNWFNDARSRAIIFVVIDGRRYKNNFEEHEKCSFLGLKMINFDKIIVTTPTQPQLNSKVGCDMKMTLIHHHHTTHKLNVINISAVPTPILTKL